MSTSARPSLSASSGETGDDAGSRAASGSDGEDPDDGGEDGPAPIQQLFATETMAELSARQGRIADAIAIYRHLLSGLGSAAPDNERRQRWTERLGALEHAPATAHARASSPRPVPPRIASASAPASEPTGRRAAPTVTPAPPPPHQLPMVIRQPVRSGQIVYAEKGDLIVMAPVNSGAQVIADGNIHIYATLRGRAVAGVRGAADAQVFCMALEAELVGVDVGYVPSAEIPAALWGKPTRVSLRDGVCVIEPLVTPANPPPPERAAATGGWLWRKKAQ